MTDGGLCLRPTYYGMVIRVRAEPAAVVHGRPSPAPTRSDRFPVASNAVTPLGAQTVVVVVAGHHLAVVRKATK